jgi:hypothetical protein
MLNAMLEVGDIVYPWGFSHIAGKVVAIEPGEALWPRVYVRWGGTRTARFRGVLAHSAADLGKLSYRVDRDRNRLKETERIYRRAQRLPDDFDPNVT